MKTYHNTAMQLIYIILVCIGTFAISFGYATDVDTLVFQGADFLYKEDLVNAAKNFQMAVKLDPNNEFAHNKLGVVYAKQNKFNDAFKEFSVVVKIDHSNTFAHKWLGIISLEKGDLDNAFARFNTIIEIDPTNADAYYFLGAIYNIRHNQAKAIEYLKKAREAASQEPDTHYRLARAFHSADMLNNALLEYTRAVELKPMYTKAINQIGWIYYNSGNVNAGIAQWQKTLKINSKDRDAAFNLAKAYNDLAFKALQQKRKKEAISYWKKTLAVNPGNKAAKYYLKKYK